MPGLSSNTFLTGKSLTLNIENSMASLEIPATGPGHAGSAAGNFLGPIWLRSTEEMGISGNCTTSSFHCDGESQTECYSTLAGKAGRDRNSWTHQRAVVARQPPSLKSKERQASPRKERQTQHWLACSTTQRRTSYVQTSTEGQVWAAQGLRTLQATDKGGVHTCSVFSAEVYWGFKRKTGQGTLSGGGLQEEYSCHQQKRQKATPDSSPSRTKRLWPLRQGSKSHHSHSRGEDSHDSVRQKEKTLFYLGTMRSLWSPERENYPSQPRLLLAPRRQKVPLWGQGA